MDGVKWIKIVVGIFDDEKIKLIEAMPEADSIIVIWFKLLCLAGKENMGGVLMMSDRIAYTDEMLATIFRRPLPVVRLALNVFQQFGMIEIINRAVTIPNWDKHQAADKLDGAREKTRVRVENYRARQKAIAGGNVTSNVTVTDGNAIEEERERELEKEIEREDESADKPPRKHKHGQYGHVLITDEEHAKLIDDLGAAEADRVIEYVDRYAEESGKRYKNWNLTLRRASRDGWGLQNKGKNETTEAQDEYGFGKGV